MVNVLRGRPEGVDSTWVEVDCQDLVIKLSVSGQRTVALRDNMFQSGAAASHWKLHGHHLCAAFPPRNKR